MLWGTPYSDHAVYITQCDEVKINHQLIQDTEGDVHEPPKSYYMGIDLDPVIMFKTKNEHASNNVFEILKNHYPDKKVSLRYYNFIVENKFNISKWNC